MSLSNDVHKIEIHKIFQSPIQKLNRKGRERENGKRNQSKKFAQCRVEVDQLMVQDKLRNLPNNQQFTDERRGGG